MNYTQRPYRGETDLPAMLALKQLCTTPQNIYDRPTISDLRRLFVPFIEVTTGASDKQSWQQALRGMSLENRQRAATQRFTALWEDASGQLVAYALIAQPGCILTFQVHPQAQGQGIEAEILAWGLAQAQLIAGTQGTSRELWCRCHEGEQERRSMLEATGFLPIFERDLRLVHALAQPLPPVSLPASFSLKRGVKPEEFDAYQELHQAVFEGAGINMDDHESSVYQPELDLIAVGPTGQFGAFCLCELKQVTDSQGERLVGEVGVIGTRPELQRQGLGRALLLTGLRQMQERGATGAYLKTSESHVPAQRLFASVGFTHLSSWQWYAKTVEPFRCSTLQDSPRRGKPVRGESSHRASTARTTRAESVPAVPATGSPVRNCSGQVPLHLPHLDTLVSHKLHTGVPVYSAAPILRSRSGAEPSGSRCNSTLTWRGFAVAVPCH